MQLYSSHMMIDDHCFTLFLKREYFFLKHGTRSKLDHVARIALQCDIFIVAVSRSMQLLQRQQFQVCEEHLSVANDTLISHSSRITNSTNTRLQSETATE
jgi:hypothetical protein